MAALLILLAAAVAAALLFAAASWRGAALQRRLDALAARAAVAAPPTDLYEHLERPASALGARLAWAAGGSAAGTLALAASGLVRGPPLLPLAMLLAAAGYLAPALLARARVRRQRAAILRALPDVLDLLVICVEAGLGLNAAFQRIADRIGGSAPVLGEAFRGIHLQIQAGRSREEALRAMAARVGVEELRSLSILLIQTDRLGTSVADALRIHSEALRTRFHHRAEARAARATVHLAFPLVLCIFPALLAVVVGPAAVTLFAAIGGKP